MLAVANFNWGRSQCQFLPGAICENLTSFGGVLRQSAGQTPLSEVLRYGAAGSSGTVIEPYSILAKFPHPVIHLHYRRGCSLAEAFYLSVPAPYQLLIVGDPLCRPYATPPRVAVEGVRPGEEVAGEVEITPTAKAFPGQAVDHFQLFVDGRLRQACAPGSQFILNSEKMPDGHHEFRVVAVASDNIQTQGRMIVPVRVTNRNRGDNSAVGDARAAELGSAGPHRRRLSQLHAADGLQQAEHGGGSVGFPANHHFFTSRPGVGPHQPLGGRVG